MAAASRKRTLNSMTGFGRAQVSEGDQTVTVVLNTVNSRHLKIHARLPEALYPFEKDIHDLVRKNLLRGSVNASITYKSLRPEMSYVLSDETIKGYLKQFRALKKETRLNGEINLGTLIGLPGVVVSLPRDGASDSRAWKLAKKAIVQALAAMQEMRAKEGLALQKDLFARIKKIETMLTRVRKHAPAVITDYRKKLKARIKALLINTSTALNEDTLAREVAIFADRCDISEEMTRLATHLKHLVSVVNGEEHPGKKLDFITQEMLRETNTLGAKANSSQLSRLVIQMKAEIGKIKEQIQNVE